MSSGRALSTKGVGLSGVSVSTKGVIDEIASGATGGPAMGPDQALALSLTSDPIMIVIPTATHACLMAAENITANLRARQPSSLVLPSLYKRAYLIANQTDEIAVVKP